MVRKSSCDAARAGPRSNTSATTRASLGRTRKPWAGELAKPPEESQVGTIAAQSVWPRLPTRMNQWMSSARRLHASYSGRNLGRVSAWCSVNRSYSGVIESHGRPSAWRCDSRLARYFAILCSSFARRSRSRCSGVLTTRRTRSSTTRPCALSQCVTVRQRQGGVALPWMRQIPLPVIA